MNTLSDITRRRTARQMGVLRTASGGWVLPEDIVATFRAAGLYDITRQAAYGMARSLERQGYVEAGETLSFDTGRRRVCFRATAQGRRVLRAIQDIVLMNRRINYAIKTN